MLPVENIVCLSENAFHSMLISSVEAFPASMLSQKSRRAKGCSPDGEVIGFLFGQRMKRSEEQTVFNVTLAVPLQIVMKRGPDEVSASEHHSDRVKEILESYPNLEYLGGFHSHPYKKVDFSDSTSATLSPSDIEDLEADVKKLKTSLVEIVFSLTNLDKNLTSDASRLNGHLIKGYCGKFKFVIGAYAGEVGEKPSPIDKFVCPSVTGMANIDRIKPAGEADE